MGIKNLFRRREKTFIEKWNKMKNDIHTHYGYEFNLIPDKLLNEFFNELAKNLSEFSINDKSLENLPQLRGFYKNFPVKIEYLETIISDWVEPGKIYINIKTDMPDPMRQLIIRGGSLIDYNLCITLWRNPDKIPKKLNPEDPWHVDDINRIFLAKGIYIECPDKDTMINTSFLNTFSGDLRSDMINHIEIMKIDSLGFHHDRIIIAVTQNNFFSQNDPVAFVLQGLDLLSRIVSEIQTIDVTVIKETLKHEETKKVNLRTCIYCTSKFILTEKCACPNCGAAVTE